MYMYVHVCVCMCMYVYVYVCVYMYVYECVYMHVYVCLYVRVRLCVRVFVRARWDLPHFWDVLSACPESGEFCSHAERSFLHPVVPCVLVLAELC